jgi:hypothetical protein
MLKLQKTIPSCGFCRYFHYISEETVESSRDRRQKNVQTGSKPSVPKPKQKALPAPEQKLAIEDIRVEEEAEEEIDEDVGEDGDDDAASSSTSPVQDLLAKLRSLSKEDLRKVKKTIKKL